MSFWRCYLSLTLLFLCKQCSHGYKDTRYFNAGNNLRLSHISHNNNNHNNLILRSSLSSEVYGENEPQILSFIEPKTNVNVVLVGAMHYNPWSISLASNTVKNLGNADLLHSIIVESCEDRWKKNINQATKWKYSSKNL